MKVKIVDENGGTLVITPETETEVFALRKWSEDFNNQKGGGVQTVRTIETDHIEGQI